MYSDGDFALNQYLPYTLVPFYPLFQERSGERVERNQADWEVGALFSHAGLAHANTFQHMQLTRSNGEIFKSLSKCLHTATVRYGGNFRHLVSTPILQIEFVPFLNRIISPPLRPVSPSFHHPSPSPLTYML